MNKKKFFSSVVVFVFFTFLAGVLFSGCIDDLLDRVVDQVHNPDEFETTELDINKIMALPYSELEPEEQKVKLERETINFLNELQAVSSLKAIDAFENFIDLLEDDEPKIDEPKSEKSGIWEVYNIDASLAYGVFTWNNSTRKWTKSDSKSELKFVFPAASNSSSNNASVTLSSNKSNSTLMIEDSYTDTEYSEDDRHSRVNINLPGSISGILSIDNKEIAKVEFVADYVKYSKPIIYEDIEDWGVDGEEKWTTTVEGSYPVVTKLRITTNEGYVLWYSLDGSGRDSKLEMLLSKGDKTLLESVFAFDMDFKSLIDAGSDDIEDLLDLSKLNASGYMKLMDSLAIVYQIDAANLAREIDRIESAYNEPNSNSEDYYEKLGPIQKKYIDDMVAAINQYVTASLVSLEDGFIIAELVTRSEFEPYENSDYWSGNYWECCWKWDDVLQEYIEVEPTFKYNRYEPVVYLRFNDNTLVEAETYFGSGFDGLEKKWEDFVDAFDR